jgi:small-conductance mechanosensitive channel
MVPTWLMAWAEPAEWLLGSLALGWLLNALARPRLRAQPGAGRAALAWRGLEAGLAYWPAWAAVLGLTLAAGRAPLDAGTAALLHRGLAAALALCATLSAARFSSLALEGFGRERGLHLSTLSLTRGLSQALVYALGLLLVLDSLGVSIAPLLTALGVGSLAVALALQNTLSDLFAGFHILANGQIAVGDFLKLDSGQSGEVVDIGWRSTRLRELAGNLVLVPNHRLAQLVVTNMDRPQRDQAVLVSLGVAYGSDLGRVEAETVAVARQVMRQVPGGVPDFEPFIRYNAFGDSAIQFTVILRGQTYVDQYLLTHEFIKRLHARYGELGIEIPFPQRVLTMTAPPRSDPDRPPRNA